MARRRWMRTGLAVAAVLLLGFAGGCSGGGGAFCDTAEPPATAAAALAASYRGVSTTVGTPLSVVPARAGLPIVQSSLGSGILPPGMALNPDGSLTGTPTQAGVYPLVVNLCSQSQCVARPVVITVNSPAASPLLASYSDAATWVGTPLAVNLDPGTVNGPVTGAVLVSGLGSLPPGMSVTPDGVISGTPTVAGTYPATLDLSNAAGAHVAAPVVITVSRSASTALSAVYPPAAGWVDSPLSIPSPVITGGPAVASLLAGGLLPPGMTLNPDGSLSGTPASPGSYTALVSLENASGGRTTVPLRIEVNMAGVARPLSGGYTALTTPVDVPITALVPSIVNGPVTGAQVASGSLPPGLVLNADGSITGTPSAPGLYELSVRLGNADGASTVVQVRILVTGLGVTYPTPRYFTQGIVISAQTPTVSGPAGTLSCSVHSGTLPSGLTLAADGTVTGTPDTPGTSTFTIGATLGSRSAVSNSVTYIVEPGTPLAEGYVSQVFSVGTAITPQLPSLGNATPGVPTTFALTSGSLPPGLHLDPATGALTGTPTSAGSYPLTVTATNGTRTATATPTYTVVPSGSLGLSYATPQSFVQGMAIPAQSPLLTDAAPGVATTYTVSSGALPAGLSLASGTGAITGVPSASGASTFAVTATNGSRTATATVTYHVLSSATLSLGYATPQMFPAGTAIPVQSPAITNSVGAVGYAVTAGSLPGGLTLDAATGAVSGTPSFPGVYSFVITATDSLAHVASAGATYTVTSAAALSEVYASRTFTAGVAIAVQSPAMANETPGVPTRFSLAGGSLPAGLSLDADTGAISGTPAAAGTFTFTVAAQNGTRTATSAPTYTVLAYPTANLAANPSTVPMGQSSSLTCLFTGSSDGTAILTGDGLATPLTVTSGSSIPTGIVNATGTRHYTLTVVNAAGVSVTSTTSVQWIPAPSDTWTITIPQSGVGSPFRPDAGNLLHGQISISVPDQGQSTCGPVTLTVNKEASLPGAIVASARNYSTTFNIASSLGYPFRVPITITLAYDPSLSTPNLTSGDVPMPFFWDPSYQKWVSTGLKSVDATNHTVTFTTLLPGRYAILGIPGLSPADQALGFASAADGWRQINPSTYDLPGGAGLGMSSFAAWFQPFRKPSSGNVGLYNQFPTVTDVNAAALISRLANGTLDSWATLWNQGAYQLTPRQTGLALLSGLVITGQPQVFLMADSPAQNNAVATAIYSYTQGSGKFGVSDPNYPGDALSITWNSSTGAFSAYDRAQGYSPALAKFAFEGQTSIHRLADYDRVFSGALGGFPSATYATIGLSDVGGNASPDVASTLVVGSNQNVTVSGIVTNGDEDATYLYWSQNGSAPRTAVPLTPVDAAHSSFSFTIPALADPYGTTVVLETTSTPCDPTFSHSGYLQFTVQQAGLSPWFPNSCFENGSSDPTPWVLQQGGDDAHNSTPGYGNYHVYYPASPTYSPATGEMDGYTINWSNGSLDSALVHSPIHAADTNVPAIASVLDSDYAYRINNPGTGAHISRMRQTITVPGSIARPKLIFYWAGAMQSAGHTPDQLPYVDILVQDADNAYETLYSVHHYPPSTVGATTYTDGYPGWVAGSGSGPDQWFGINWQKVSLNLGASRQGHHLVITVTAADCTQGGHGGYAYIDNVGCH